MKVFSVTIQDDKEHMFMELLNSVSFVKKIEAIPDDENIPQRQNMAYRIFVNPSALSFFRASVQTR